MPRVRLPLAEDGQDNRNMGEHTEPPQRRIFGGAKGGSLRERPLKVLKFQQISGYLVRPARGSSNFLQGEDSVEFGQVFDELARWNDILKHQDTTILRGPRP